MKILITGFDPCKNVPKPVTRVLVCPILGVKLVTLFCNPEIALDAVVCHVFRLFTSSCISDTAPAADDALLLAFSALVTAVYNFVSIVENAPFRSPKNVGLSVPIHCGKS